MSISVQID